MRAQNSINITLIFWGFHGFAVYTLPAILVSFLAYRKGLPLAMRTAFYPIIGRKIFGRAGDLIDILSIICIIFGVATSLVIGAQMLNNGINQLNSDFDVTRGNQTIMVWGLTIIATVSVVSGIRLGIRRLSQLCILTSK